MSVTHHPKDLMQVILKIIIYQVYLMWKSPKKCLGFFYPSIVKQCSAWPFDFEWKFYYYCNTWAALTYVCLLINQFLDFISRSRILLKTQYFPSESFVIEKKIKVFNISENNIINVKVAKVVGYLTCIIENEPNIFF
jgi:hypothetical protein